MSPDIHTLTGAYAVDALPDDEREAFEAHLAVCAACAQEVAELQATASHLGAASVAAPPAGMRDAVMARIGEVRQEAPVVGPDAEVTRVAAPRRWTSMLLAPAAAILAVAVVGLSALVASLNGRVAEVESTSIQVADLIAAADVQMIDIETPGSETARLVMSPSRGEAVLTVDGMTAAPADHAFVVWLIDEAGTPQAVGTFDVDERGRATELLDGQLATTAAIGVTVEPDDQPHTAPTTDPVMLVEMPAV